MISIKLLDDYISRNGLIGAIGLDPNVELNCKESKGRLIGVYDNALRLQRTQIYTD